MTPRILPTTEQLYHFAKTHSGPNISCPMKNSWVQWKKEPLVGCWVYAGDEKLSTYLGFFGTWNSKQTNPQTTPSWWFQPKNMSQSFIISSKNREEIWVTTTPKLSHIPCPLMLCFPKRASPLHQKWLGFNLLSGTVVCSSTSLHCTTWVPMKKGPPGCFGVARGWNTTHLCGDYIQLGIYGVI